MPIEAARSSQEMRSRPHIKFSARDTYIDQKRRIYFDAQSDLLRRSRDSDRPVD
jgi:hypothetical protein